MKKSISCILCGMLVLSSFLVAGTSINEKQKIQTPENTLLEEYIPVIFWVNITVASDGRPVIQLHDIDSVINNWTDENHIVKIMSKIDNPFNNTGARSYYWRIAEWSNQSSKLKSWLMFWVANGNVKTQQSSWISNLHIEWKAGDNDTIIKEFPIDIVINPLAAFQICMWVGWVSENVLYHMWSALDYNPITTVTI